MFGCYYKSIDICINQTNMKPGTLVKYAHPMADEKNLIFVVLEFHADVQRGLMQLVDASLRFPPTYVFRLNEIVTN